MTSTRAVGPRPPARRTTTASGPAARRPSGARPAGSRRPRRRRSGPPWRRVLGWWPALVVLLAVVAAVAWVPEEDLPPPVAGRCTVPGTDVVLTTEQAANAATIAAVARSRGLPPRATVIALATAQQESRIRNLDYGDRDSLGLFQQRPSQGWGSEAEIQDPVYSAGTFFDTLVEVPGWETGRLTEVAQAVQRSGFPEAYQQWEGLAEALTPALLGDTPGQLSCTYSPPAEAGQLEGRTAAVADVVRREAGPAEVGAGGLVTVPGEGWPAASWAVAHASRLQLVSVRHAGWAWTPGAGWVQGDPDPGVLTLQLAP